MYFVYIEQNSHNIEALNRQNSFLLRLSFTNTRYAPARIRMFTANPVHDFREYFIHAKVPARLAHNSRPSPRT